MNVLIKNNIILFFIIKYKILNIINCFRTLQKLKRRHVNHREYHNSRKFTREAGTSTSAVYLDEEERTLRSDNGFQTVY